VQAAPTEPDATPDAATRDAQSAPQPAIVVPAAAVGNLRRSMMMAAGMGLASLVLLGLLGHVLMGVFLCVGLALGAFNSRLVQRAVVGYAASGATNKRARFTRSVLGRLGLVTVLAVGSALLARPDGLGVFAGLAFFQLLMLGGATVPLIKQLKQS
jgi:hypothetical protein